MKPGTAITLYNRGINVHGALYLGHGVFVSKYGVSGVVFNSFRDLYDTYIEGKEDNFHVKALRVHGDPYLDIPGISLTEEAPKSFVRRVLAHFPKADSIVDIPLLPLLNQKFIALLKKGCSREMYLDKTKQKVDFYLCAPLISMG